MADMSKLKDDALRRKKEHEDIERRKKLESMTGSSNKGGARGNANRNSGRSSSRSSAKNAPNKRNSSASAIRNSARGAKGNGAGANLDVRNNNRGQKKSGKSSSRWVIDILLVLAGLMVVVYFVSQVL